MALQHYDVPDVTTPGAFVERYWEPVNTPVLDAQGAVTGIIHHVVNVTDRVRADAQLRESQAREQQALAQAQAERATLQNTLEQTPVAIAILEGADYVVTFANEGMRLLWGRPLAPLLGRPHFEALPDLAGQGFEAIFAHAYQHGQPTYLHEQRVQIDRVGTGQLIPGYFNIVYQPLRDGQNCITGIVASATEVTEQVQARQRVQDLNEDLTASNEEYLQANAALGEIQLQLAQLNQELEARVAARTQEVLVAQADAHAQQTALLAATQRRVEEREAFYQVFEQAPAAVALLRSPGHRFEFVNPAYQALFSGRPLAGRDAAEAVPELLDQGFVALLDQVYQTGETFFGTEQPFTPVLADGQPGPTRYFNFTYQPYREAGAIGGISIFAFDVTEQVRARRERLAQQRQLLNLFAQAPVAICVFRGPDYVLDVLNPPMAQLAGKPVADLVGQPLLVAMPELADQGLVTLLDQVRRTGLPYAAQEQPLRLSFDAPHVISYLNFVYQPLHDEQTLMLDVVCIAVDVTEQVRARQQVQDLNEELTATNEELHQRNTQLMHTNADLDNFVYTASHDLKSPISNIEGLLLVLPELLPEAVRTDEQVAPVLARMQESAERFKRTLGHLTDVSRLQAEFAQPAEAVRLADVVEDVRQDLLPQLTAAHGQLEVAVDESWPRVFSAKNLRSVVYNLLSNALKYQAPDRPPLVRIACEHVGPHFVLTVQDNGLGLSEQQQARLFQLFQRLHTHVEGTGVGLYMVKRIVEQAGGRITVQSQADVGTTFTLVFPA
jgi:signal transduction histidine kinase